MSQPILSNIGQPNNAIVPCGKKMQYLCAELFIPMFNINATVGANQAYSAGTYTFVDLPVPRKAYINAVFQLSTAVPFQVYFQFATISSTSTSNSYQIYLSYQTENNGLTVVIPPQEIILPPHAVAGNNTFTIIPSATVTIQGGPIYYIETPIEDVEPAV